MGRMAWNITDPTISRVEIFLASRVPCHLSITQGTNEGISILYFDVKDATGEFPTN